MLKESMGRATNELQVVKGGRGYVYLWKPYPLSRMYCVMERPYFHKCTFSARTVSWQPPPIIHVCRIIQKELFLSVLLHFLSWVNILPFDISEKVVNKLTFSGEEFKGH